MEIFVYQLNRCNGCQLCVRHVPDAGGGCGEKESLISILTHPQFGTSQPLVDQACMWEIVMVCILVCSRVFCIWLLRDWGRLMANSDWNPVPIVVKEKRP